MSILSEKIDWIEKQAAENLKFRLQNCETLSKEANNLLTLLLAAIGAVVAYAIKSVGNETLNSLLVAAISTGAWLVLVAMILVVKCIMTSELIPLGNEPKNLMLEDYSLDQIKVFELDNVQDSINKMAFRNGNTAYWLDKARLAAVLSPLIFILTWAFWTYLESLCAQVV